MLVFCFFLFGNLLAQHFPIQRLTVEEGLGHSITYRTTQTSDGYIWFSTDNGLTRYDGVRFKNFTTQDGLPSNFIFDVVEWKGKLHVATLGGGIVIYENGEFIPAFDSTSSQPLHPVEMRISKEYFLVLDRFKDFHLLKGNRFHKVDAADLNLEPGTSLEFYNAEIFESLAFVATNRGLFVLSGNTFSRIDLNLPKPSSIYRVARNDENNLLIVIDSYLIEFNPKTRQYTTLIRDEYFSRFSDILVDSENNIWVNTVAGKLFFINKTVSGYHTLQVLEEIVINHLFEDREKNIWLSTYGEGVWLIQSTHVRNHPIKGYIVSDMVVDPRAGDLVVTTVNAGLKIFEQEKNRFLTEKKTGKLQKIFEPKRFLGSGLNLPDGSLLLASGNTVLRVRENIIDSIVAENPVSALYYQPGKNRIWIGCRFLLAYCDYDMEQLTVVEGLESKVVRAIEELPDGRILIGTDSGVLAGDENGFDPFPAEPVLQHANVNTLFFDRDKKQLWAGTNAGLAWLKDGRLQLVDNAITKIRCNSIAIDENGHMYIGSVKGLIHYDGNTFEVLTTKEGLSQSNIIRVKYQPDKNLLTLLSPNAISTIDTENFLGILRFELPDILIEEISTPEKKIPFSGNLMEFSSPVKQLNIRFSTPQIRNREKIGYSYRINNKPWTGLNGDEIALHALPMGKLTIAIKAFKVNNESEQKILTLSFFIPPPFYFQWWFISIFLTCALLSVFFLVVYYSKSKNKKLVEENKRLDVEHKALRNLLNPHFLYNAINSIHAFILQNDQKKTLAYLSKFSQLVRLNLELLSTDHATLDKEIKNISLYLEFEKLRFAEKLNYTIDIDPKVVQSEIIVPSFIIQPFVENAIWHGLLPREEGGNLTLKVRLLQNIIVITIEDNGIGINQSLRHPKTEIDKKASMGINIIRERFELLRKVSAGYHLSITDKSDLDGTPAGTGTQITITIPVGV